MNNLPPGTTQDMIDAQCAPIPLRMESCYDCESLYDASKMYSWDRYNFMSHKREGVYLCEECVPKCQWTYNDLERTKCGRIQSPNAQGPWCAEHEKEAESLEAAESEESCSDTKH
jgi:hypothetical protein